MPEFERFDCDEVGDVTVVRFRDRELVEDEHIHQLGQELFQLVDDEGRTKIVFSLTAVEFLSSCALGKFVAMEKRVKDRGGAVKMSNVHPEIAQVLSVTRLNDLFDIQNDEADAVAAF